MRNFLLLFVFLALSALAHTHAETPAPYQFITEIPIGGEGGWDILTIDTAARRLYLSHATKVVVVDLATKRDCRRDRRYARCSRVRRRAGSAARFFVQRQGNEGQRGRSKDAETISKVETGENPDALVYESKRGEVYVFNHTGKSATVIDAKNATCRGHDSARGKPGVCRGGSCRGAHLLQSRGQKRSRGDRRRQTRSGGALATGAR